MAIHSSILAWRILWTEKPGRLQSMDLKKVGKTTRPFRNDLNQIPYDYTVEVTNRFKGLDIRVPEKLWTEVRNIVQEVVIKTIPKREMQKGKMIV